VAVGNCHAGLEQTLLLENVPGFAAGSRIMVAGVGRRNWPMCSRPDWFSSFDLNSQKRVHRPHRATGWSLANPELIELRERSHQVQCKRCNQLGECKFFRGNRLMTEQHTITTPITNVNGLVAPCARTSGRLKDATAGPLIIVAIAIRPRASTTSPVFSAIAVQRHAKKTTPPANNEIANVASSRSGGPKSVNTDDKRPATYTTTNPKGTLSSNRNLHLLASWTFPCKSSTC